MTDARERHRLASARWRAAHPPHNEIRRQQIRAALDSPVKICARCTLPKSRETDFHKSRKSKDGLQSYCKPCASAATAAQIMKKARQKRMPRAAPHAHTADP
jgi:hypothetical protein